jgi:hypothetical protein
MISKFFPGLYPGPPVKRAGQGRGGKEGEERGGREGRGERGGREGRGILYPHFLKQSYARANIGLEILFVCDAYACAAYITS